MFQEIKASLQQLYLEDERPWLVGFSGGKDSTMLASLIFDAVLSIPAEQVRRFVYRLLSAVFAVPSAVYRTYDSRHCRNDRRHAGPHAEVLRAEQPEY
jgi:DNA sulfur modification protein DndC